ncbi:hypothetical protein C8J56DRAFT_962837, partial [Mycena floridula]
VWMLLVLSVTGSLFTIATAQPPGSRLTARGPPQQEIHPFRAYLATSSSMFSLTILSCLNAQLEFHRRTLGPVVPLTITAGLEEGFPRTMLETRRTLQIPTDFVQSAASSGPVGPQDIGCRFAYAFEGAEAATVSM